MISMGLMGTTEVVPFYKIFWGWGGEWALELGFVESGGICCISDALRLV
jgi:hypothetical protein